MDLQAIWFFLWGLLWALFFMTDGYDFGIGTLYPFLGKTETEKRIMINVIGPLWDGNQVWLITAGGVTFAAFPLVYSVMFSTLYTALILLLFTLIIRGVSFEMRGQVDDPRWRKLWDICIFIGSAAPALLLGVAFANIFKGIPFDADYVFHGNLFTLLNPYGLLGGILFVMLFTVHGALWLAVKTEDTLHDKAVATANKLWPVLVGVAVIFLVASKFATRLYDNYFTYPALFIFILVTVVALLAIKLFLAKKQYFQAWVASAVTIIGCTFFGIIGLFPTLFPSSIDAALSLTARNASSSPLTLKIMLIVVVMFLPIILIYQIWAYKLFHTKVTADTIASGEAVY